MAFNVAIVVAMVMVDDYISSNSTIASHAAITFVVIILTIATTVGYQVGIYARHQELLCRFRNAL